MSTDNSTNEIQDLQPADEQADGVRGGAKDDAPKAEKKDKKAKKTNEVEAFG